MAKTTTSKSYRAKCRTCKDYIGERTNVESEATADVNRHKAIKGNSEHDAFVEEKQTAKRVRKNTQN